jgi:hypothetical protein
MGAFDKAWLRQKFLESNEMLRCAILKMVFESKFFQRVLWDDFDAFEERILKEYTALNGKQKDFVAYLLSRSRLNEAESYLEGSPNKEASDLVSKYKNSQAYH